MNHAAKDAATDFHRSTVCDAGIDAHFVSCETTIIASNRRM
jgi:hypothetical protein